MAPEQGGRSLCIDEETALDFAQGRLGADEIDRIDEHADRCHSCRVVLAEATRAFREPSPAAVPSSRVSFTRFVPGDTLAGRYQIVRFIARGGMGEVYEAEDLILGTRLALKTLAATISDDQRAIHRLKQEVNLARRITHPNVCRIFDLGVHEQSSAGVPALGLLFITMELVPGRSLGERLRKEGRLDPAEAAPIVQAMVAAIGAAHRADIVHRDFKSDNVMLGLDDGGEPRVVVMDFGLARAALAPDTISIERPALAGTLHYMAPEQIEGKPLGPATDIYALGVVIFEMLTGELPFRGEDPMVAALKRLTEAPPALATIVRNLDPGWQRLVTACLERDPARRPASVDEVAREVQRIHVGGGGGAGGGEKAGPEARVTPAAPLGLGLGLGLGLALRTRVAVAVAAVMMAALVLAAVTVARKRAPSAQAASTLPVLFPPASASASGTVIASGTVTGSSTSSPTAEARPAPAVPFSSGPRLGLPPAVLAPAAPGSAVASGKIFPSPYLRRVRTDGRSGLSPRLPLASASQSGKTPAASAARGAQVGVSGKASATPAGTGSASVPPSAPASVAGASTPEASTATSVPPAGQRHAPRSADPEDGFIP